MLGIPWAARVEGAGWLWDSRSRPVDLPQDCFLSMTVSWYQSLIKVLLSRFPQSCRHFQSPDLGTQYLVSLLDPPQKQTFLS